MTPSPGPAGHKISDLQVLRGVSIALVLVSHFALQPAVLEWFPHPVARVGWLGVDLFFLISGYVIIRSLARDRFEPLAFLARRVFRLTPALLVLVLVAAGLNALLAGRDLTEHVRKLFVTEWADFWKLSAALVCGYVTLQPRWSYAYGATWSLSVEDQFYAGVFVLCLASAVFARRRGPRVAAGLACGLAAGVYLYALYLRLDSLANGTALATASKTWRYLVNQRFDMLALGVVLGFADLRFRDRLAAAAARVGPHATPYLLLTPLALAALSGTHETGGRHVTGLVLPVTGWLFGLLTLTAAHGQAVPPTRGRLYRAWVFLGDRSYAIYLYHFPMMIAAWYVLSLTPSRWALLGPGRYPVAHTAVSVVLLAPLVELIYRGVELPLTAVGRRLGERLRILPAEEIEDAVPAVAGTIGPRRRAA